MVKRFDDTLEVTVFKFDLEQPINWGKDIDAELERQVSLWNKLTIIEREHIAAVRAIAEPAAEAERMAKPVSERLEQLFAKRKEIRKQNRSKVGTEHIDEEIESLKKTLKALREQAKEQRKAAYAENKDRLKALDSERFEKVKSARQNSGCWWPNYNAIVAFYDRARGRALKHGYELKEQFYNGEGRLTNQIQGGVTTAKLLDGSHPQVQIGPKPKRMRASGKRKGTSLKRGATLTVCAYTTEEGSGKRYRRMVSFPFFYYRDLPTDGLIKDVVVVRRRQADQFRYSVVFTLTKARAEVEVPKGPPVAINLGWRRTNEGGLRVATRVGLGMPLHLTPHYPAVPFTNPVFSEISGKLLHEFERYEEFQSARDNARNEIVSLIRNTIGTSSEFPMEGKVRNGQILHLYNSDRKRYQDFRWDLVSKIQKWWYGEGGAFNTWRGRLHNRDAKLRIFGERNINREQARRRQHINDARLYHYRLEARRLVGDAGLVIINEHDMSQTARKEGVLPPPARRNRVIAAPSVLRQAILNYCKKHGVEVQIVKVSGHTHWNCGREVEFAMPELPQQTCTHCHVLFDQDVNYCMSMLRNITPPQAKAA